MALQLGDLRDALLEAGASQAKADKAASEVALYETRLGGLESGIAGLKAELAGMSGRVSILTWVIGLNVALTLAVLARVFVQ